MSNSLYDIVKCKNCIFTEDCKLFDGDLDYSCGAGVRPQFMKDEFPEASLGYKLGVEFVPVTHGPAMKMIEWANKLNKIQVPGVGECLLEVLPYLMTV